MSGVEVPILEPVPQPLPTPPTLIPGQGRPIVVCNDDRLTIILEFPGVFISAALAGAVARAMMLPLHPMIGTGNPLLAVANRGMLWGLSMWLWIPEHMKMQEPNLIAWKRVRRMVKHAFIGGVLARVICNPILNAQVQIMQKGLRGGIQEMKGWFPFQKKKGLVNWWENQPTILGNALYFTLQVILFEGCRTYLLRRFDLDEKNTMTHVKVCAAAGGIATLTAGTLTWRINRNQYCSNLLRPTVFSKGYAATMLKEVPIGAASFGLYAYFMPQFSPSTPNCGFGF